MQFSRAGCGGGAVRVLAPCPGCQGVDHLFERSLCRLQVSSSCGAWLAHTLLLKILLYMLGISGGEQPASASRCMLVAVDLLACWSCTWPASLTRSLMSACWPFHGLCCAAIPFLELAAYAGYPFVPACVTAGVQLTTGSASAYHAVWAYGSLCAAIFLVRSMKRVILQEAHTYSKCRINAWLVRFSACGRDSLVCGEPMSRHHARACPASCSVAMASHTCRHRQHAPHVSAAWPCHPSVSPQRMAGAAAA